MGKGKEVGHDHVDLSQGTGGYAADGEAYGEKGEGGQCRRKLSYPEALEHFSCRVYGMASRSVNQVTLLGRLGKDAEVKGDRATFSIATSRRWKDQQSGEWKEEADWHNVVLWRGGGVLEFLVKGTQVFVQGELRSRSYEKDGAKKYVTEVVAREVILIGDGGSRRDQEDFTPGAITDDDVPF